MGPSLPTPLKRDAILGAAIVELSARGFHGARIERIAAAARANKQLIFHYFGSKEGLYSTAVSHILSTEPMPQTADSLTPPARLAWHIRSLAEWLASAPAAPRVLAECLMGIDMPAPAVAVARSWVSSASSAIKLIIDDGQRKGHFRDDLEPDVVVKLVISAAVGHSIGLFDRLEPASREPPLPALLGEVIAGYCSWT